MRLTKDTDKDNLLEKRLYCLLKFQAAVGIGHPQTLCYEKNEYKPHEIGKITSRFKREEMQCKMIATSTGKQCKYQAKDGTDYCRVHLKIRKFVFNKEQNDRWREYWRNSFAEDPLPPGAEEMVCGAKTRNGSPCMRRNLYRSGRCRLHGGLSTGPESLYNNKTL